MRPSKLPRITPSPEFVTPNPNVDVIPFNTEEQAELTHAFVSAHLPWWVIEDYKLWKFFRRYIPGAFIPNRHKLSGQLLQTEVDKIEAAITLRMRDLYATMQWDGWLNKQRQNLLAFMLTAGGEVSNLILQKYVEV